MRNILLLIPSMSGAGGSEKLVDSLSRILSSEFSVTVASFDAPTSKPFFELDAPYFPLGAWRDLPLALRPLNYLDSARRVSALRRTLKIDLTISVLWRADLINFLAIPSGKRVSLVTANIAMNRTNAMMVGFRRIVGWIYRCFDCVMAINPDIADELHSLFMLPRDKLEVFKNFVAVRPPMPVFPDGIPRFAFCGRLVYEKNVDGLLHVWAAYIARNPGHQLIIIGNGSMLEEMQALARALGLQTGTLPSDRSSQVIFVGSAKHPEDYMHGARGFLLTSRDEGVPTVAILAANLALPILGADCGGGGMRYLFCMPKLSSTPLARSIVTSAGFLLPIPTPSAPDTINIWVSAMEEADRNEALRREWHAGASKIAGEHSENSVRRSWSYLVDELFRA